MVKPGIENRAIHEKAALCIAEGLVDLGILRGQPEDLVDQDIHAAFFPHGIGHLLGLDAHDMEDLGDLAGYAPGRRRSERFGLCYLRLDRPLAAGMVVTIEPGFYQIPFLLQSPEWRSKLNNWVDWTTLANFSDVRGIRIENDVLVTEAGHEVLTSDLPIEPDDIEEQL
jgi:Xaa-Pro aminopeptidase